MEEKLSEPMGVCEWEDMQIDAEANLMGCLPNGTEQEEREKLASYIMKMSGEIWRLRMTYGEEVWRPVNMSDDEMAAERKRYEATRMTQENPDARQNG